MDSPNWLLKVLCPEKTEIFQITRMPLEAPTEGMNSKVSKALGQKLFTSGLSKASLFVSCKHTMSQDDCTILSLIASYFHLALRPLTFQERTFHFLQKFVLMTELFKTKDWRPKHS